VTAEASGSPWALAALGLGAALARRRRRKGAVK
jgi:MYXO-CTERM domain-containing protein